MFDNIDIKKTKNGYEISIPASSLWGSALKNVSRKTSTHNIAVGSIQSLDELTTGKYSYPTKPKQAIKKVRYYYIKDPLVRRIIELMAQLAATPIRLVGAQKYKKIFRTWLDQLHIANRIVKWIFLEYFLSANCFVLRQSAKIKDAFLRDLKKGDFQLTNYRFETASLSATSLETLVAKLAVARQNKQDVLSAYEEAARKLHWSKNVLPCDYTILNPEFVDIGGAPEFDLIRIFYSPSAELVKALRAAVDRQIPRFEPIARSLPLYFLAQIVGTMSLNPSEKPQTDYKLSKVRVELLPEDVRHISRMKQAYEGFAWPLLTNAFEALDRKEKLIQMDRKLIEHVIQKILLIKIGNDQFPAKPKHIAAIDKLLKQQGSVWKLVWNHAIDIQWVDVDIQPLISKDKYEPVNTDIRSCFGITPLITGESERGSVSAGLISLRGLIENISDAQQEVEAWLYHEFEFIGEKLQLDNVPKPKFNVFSLEDKVSLMKIYSALVDRGILSNQMVAELLGEDWENEILPAIRKERQLRDSGILPPLGSPYHRSSRSAPNPPTAILGGEEEQVTKEKRGSQGKPAESITEYPTTRKPRKTKGQNELASTNQQMTKDMEIKYYESLIKKYKTEELEDLASQALDILIRRYTEKGENQPFEKAVQILEHLDINILKRYDLNTLSLQTLEDLQYASEKLERCIRHVRQQLLDRWKSRHKGKQPTQDVLKKITSSAWAICRSALNE